MPIVVGYLATAEGEAALEAALAEARRREDRLVVAVSQRRGDDDAAGLEERIEAVRDRLDAEGVGYEVRQVQRGSDVADDLIAIAEETDASLIVIGLRRRSPVGKLILGSNAQRILLDAPTPVLAVKSAGER
ncbi:UspA domain protein [Beutenbergia cavernae DSM 12333]|uniref:UspA domain protein n=1 Tax=Beutenbergia cavernae (strain ATCC BAA-8 / DSM 12333 / CCUG 43141 / JCM 11478 / NBRC 16432 / NCIMB 13614 / HKI 0122) TaxID=471853 RepID=C5C5H8_BEUC1|nr:universal stress protein [Beutenbergia cavernae]ACQ80169.1 UspA domain protein [Beutenbergia cavernae DSM 12333]